MGVSVKVGSFASGTGAAGTTVAVTGVGFQPKVVKFWTTASTSGTTDDYSVSVGWGVSSTSRRAFWAGALQNADPSYAKNIVSESFCLIVWRGNPAVAVGTFDFTSQDADGFTLTVGTQFAASITIFYLALGGDDIRNVALVSFNQGAVTGDLDVTTVGFQPDFLEVLMSHAFALDTLSGAAKFNIGFTDGTNAAVASEWVNEAFTESVCQTYVRSAPGQLEISASQVGGEVRQRDSFKQWLPNGFRLDVVETSGNQVIMFGLAIQGGRWHVGDYLAPNALQDFSTTGVGWTPKGVFAVHVNTIAQSTLDTPSLNAQFSLGAATSTTARGAASATAITARQLNDQYVNAQSTATVYNFLNGIAAVTRAADFKSFDADGFTLTVTVAAPNALFGIYFVVTDNALCPPRATSIAQQRTGRRNSAGLRIGRT